MPNTRKKTKASLLAAAAATAVKEKLLSKGHTGFPCKERYVPLPMEQPKLLSKEQSASFSNELVAPVELQQEPEGEDEEENLQFGQEVVEHDDEEVEEEEMETESDNSDSYQPSEESGEEGKFISLYLPFPPPELNLTHLCGSFLELLHELFLELVFVERTLNPYSWIIP
jgi:hypothetical protein